MPVRYQLSSSPYCTTYNWSQVERRSLPWITAREELLRYFRTRMIPLELHPPLSVQSALSRRHRDLVLSCYQNKQFTMTI